MPLAVSHVNIIYPMAGINLAIFERMGYGTDMTEKKPPKMMSEKHNSHHAEKRRARRDEHRTNKGKGEFRPRKQFERKDTSKLYLYGLHTVRNALLNPDRNIIKLFATKNGFTRLELSETQATDLSWEEKLPRELDKMVGSDAVHQGAVLEATPLPHKPLDDLSDTDLVLVLDQVTDPHNVGAIMRSAVAMKAGALITTSRYSPVESGVLGKAASGALDLIDHIEVRNLAETLERLHAQGFTTIGLDSEEAVPLEAISKQKRIALVLGSEGKGLRAKTRETCQYLAKLDMPGEIKSLNVSNAAILSLYLSRGLL